MENDGLAVGLIQRDDRTAAHFAAGAAKASVVKTPPSVTTSGRRKASFPKLAGKSFNAPAPKMVRVGKEKVVRLIRRRPAMTARGCHAAVAPSRTLLEE